jgi:hypothetical protein
MGKHWANQKEKKAHKPIPNNTENGACLWGHDGRFSKNSCAYRWQGHEISKAERTDIYDKWPLGAPAKIDTLGYRTSKKGWYPPGYPRSLPAPRKGDWFLTGPTQTGYKVGRKTVPKGKNFTKDKWPYWHNSHHLIPKGTLIAEINARKCAPVMRLSMLKAKYNVNHKMNVAILPQDEEVARILGLPRHLILEGTTKKTKLKTEYFDHKEYNAAVKDRLDTILDDYSKICDKATQAHQEPDVTLTKDALEKLSRDCWKKIQSFGKSNAGLAISEIKNIPSYKKS